MDIENIIAQGEGISVEFKEAKEKVSASLYETVVSFANTNGGYILLGVDDEGNIPGIQSNISDNQKFNNNYVPSSGEIRTKSGLNPIEKITMLPDKKLQYIIKILFVSGAPISRDELTDIFVYKNLAFFRQNYLRPLETTGFIKRTNPEKPTASNQKYVITEKGKQFLTEYKF
jgi:predicted HTH transcriptional regulator